VPAIPAAPTGFGVSAVAGPSPNDTATLTWSHTGGTDLSTFTIQRATDARFTKSLNTSTVSGSLRTTTQTVNPNTTYYYRIKANNSFGESSAWTNASPFPIRTP